MIGLRTIRGLLRRPPVGSTPAQVVHRENKWRLLRYVPPADGPQHRTPVLVVPSLINRHYVLDLHPGASFVRWLIDRGHDVLLLDWGRPGPEDRYLTFDDICDRYLGRAIRKAARMGGSGRVHLLGYCLGGTLTAIHTAVRPRCIASLTALAAPVDFHDEGLLSVWCRTRSFDPQVVVDAFGNAPWPLLQAAFHLLKPTLPMVKWFKLLERGHDEEFVAGFSAVERWGNDNVSFPGCCFARYIQALYRDNQLMRDQLTLSGHPVRLHAITCPTLAVTFEDDHIVPAQSAAALLDAIASPVRRRIHLPGGHVGSVVSRRARAKLWPALSEFWVEHEPHQQPRPVAAAAY